MSSDELPASLPDVPYGMVSPLIPLLARAHRAKAHELLEGTGLSAGQEMMIKRLYEQPGSSQADLTRWLGVEPPTTAKMLARLERAGFVERARSTTDRRVMVVQLTDKGRATYERVNSIWADLDRITTAGLTGDEKALLTQLVRRALDNLAAPTTE